jgi:hypothetical protein
MISQFVFPESPLWWSEMYPLAQFLHVFFVNKG